MRSIPALTRQGSNQPIHFKKEGEKGEVKTIKWSRLRFVDKAKLFNWWSIISIFFNIFQIIGSVSLMVRAQQTLSFSEAMIGLGCAGAWLGLVRYTGFFTQVNKTFFRAIPQIAKTMIGIIPVFIGLSFLAICLFWHSDRFASSNMSLYQLFAMMNGDNLAAIHEDISRTHLLAANIFLYLYVFFAISTIMNVFIIIVEESYVIEKYVNPAEQLQTSKGLNDYIQRKYNIKVDNLD